MKSILFITAFPPCQKTAGQDYTRRLILDLQTKGYKISLIYAEYPGHIVELNNEVEIIGIIKPSLTNCFYIKKVHPFFSKRFNPNILTTIKKIADNFDMIYFDFSQVHLYSLFVNHPNKILMCHDVIAQKFERKGILQLPWIKNTENKLLKTATKIITFSKKDCEFIKKSYNLDSSNVNFYLKNPSFKYDEQILDYNHFCFYGAWNRQENTECLLWFIKQVYPKINSNLVFDIIGGGMPDNLQKKLKVYKNINYLGFVEDPVKSISKCQALIAPLHKGAGVKVKVIDALTSGTSVIGTKITFEGIEDNKTNKLFYTAVKPEEYIKYLSYWKNITVEQKQLAADEFFIRYDSNHFPDLIK